MDEAFRTIRKLNGGKNKSDNKIRHTNENLPIYN